MGTDVEAVVEAEEPRVTQLITLAKELGYVVQKLNSLGEELARAISTKLVNRIGASVYQSAAFSLPVFPLQAAQELLAPACITTRTNAVVTWRADTMASLRSLLGDFLSQHDPQVKGLSRAQQSPSERAIRVLATLIPPVEISWVRSHSREKLYVNLLYVLSDDVGELHKPKDSQRREIQFTQAEESEIRREVLNDLLLMSQAEKPLSPAYWRQLGMEDQALNMEAVLAAPPPSRRP